MRMPVTNCGMNFSEPQTKPAPVLYSRQTAPFSYLGAKVIAQEAMALQEREQQRVHTQIKRRQRLIAEEARKRLERAAPRPFSAQRTFPISTERKDRLARMGAIAVEAEKALQRAKPARPNSAPGWRVAKVHESSDFAQVGAVVAMSGRKYDDPGREQKLGGAERSATLARAMAVRKGADVEYRQWAAHNLKARDAHWTHPDIHALYGALPKKRTGATIQECLQPELHRPSTGSAAQTSGSGSHNTAEAEPLMAARLHTRGLACTRPTVALKKSDSRRQATQPHVAPWPAPLPGGRLGKWGAEESA